MITGIALGGASGFVYAWESWLRIAILAAALFGLPPIRRVALQSNSARHIVSALDGALHLEGVDRFEVQLNQRLIQGTQPRIRF